MSYQTPLKIAQAIHDIDSKKYFLPSIQREFVWGTAQIEKLFDSIMRDYPINSFLFWKVDKSNTSKYKFYEFLRDYHEKDSRHNPKASLNRSDDITAILDGQQRMTSLYIGLKGTYAYKIPHKRWDNPQAYPKRKLYLNLIGPAVERDDFMYDFLFLTEEEVADYYKNENEVGKKEYYWFPVGEILNFDEEGDLNEYLIENDLNILPKEQAKFANRTIFRLFDAIHRKGTISYYLEESQELDKVLNIFIRVNSGGTQLSYSDLLLSVATAQWEKKDAREEINEVVDDINEIGRGFNISKDLLLKASLVLTDCPDIRFKVDNFERRNMLVIEKEWDKIATSMRLAVELVASFGFNRDNLTSNNPLIPIAYYINKIGNPEKFVESSKYAKDRMNIKKWFIASILRRVFSYSSSDLILKQICDVIAKNHDRFPINQIYEKFHKSNRDLTFDDDSVRDLLYTKYGSGDVLMLMSILYPWADLKNNFHIDHIHPKSMFTRKKLKKAGVSEEDMEFCLTNYNFIGNLQLLESTPNEEKKAMLFGKWIDKHYSDQDQRKDYMKKNNIPDVDFGLDNFVEFFEEREKMLFKALKKALA